MELRLNPIDPPYIDPTRAFHIFRAMSRFTNPLDVVGFKKWVESLSDADCQILLIATTQEVL